MRLHAKYPSSKLS